MLYANYLDKYNVYTVKKINNFHANNCNKKKYKTKKVFRTIVCDTNHYLHNKYMKILNAALKTLISLKSALFT